MKAYYKVLLPAVAIAIALTGCKGAETALPTDITAGEEITVVEEVATLSQPEKTVAQQVEQSAMSNETTQKTTAKDGAETTKEITTQKNTTATGTTKKNATTTSKNVPAQAGITTAKSTTKASTTKAGSTVHTPENSGSSGKQTTKPSAAKPTTTKASSTKPSTTKPVETKPTTTKPTTTKPGESGTGSVAKGNLISGRISYMNEAKDSYLNQLTPAKLKLFGITGTFKKEDWKVYTIDVELENKENVPVTIYHLDVTNNGTGHVYVNGDTAGDIGLPAGGSITNRFYILAPAADKDAVVLGKIKKLEMRVQYAATSEDDEATPAYVYSKIG